MIHWLQLRRFFFLGRQNELEEVLF
jgi:hypothetical protein